MLISEKTGFIRTLAMSITNICAEMSKNLMEFTLEKLYCKGLLEEKCRHELINHTKIGSMVMN